MSDDADPVKNEAKDVAAKAAGSAVSSALPKTPPKGAPGGKVPGRPAAPDLAARKPAVPRMPSASPGSMPKAPNLPGAPKAMSKAVPKAPFVPGAPSLPGGPSVPGAPSLPGAPSVPGAPSMGAPSRPSLAAVPSVGSAAMAAMGASGPAAAAAAVAAQAVPGVAPLVEAIPTLARIADLPGAIVDAFRGGGAKPLPRVRYGFTADDAVEWEVVRIFMTEELGEAYRLDVNLVTREMDADADALLGQSCIVDFERGEQRRSIHGIIVQVDVTALTHDQLHVCVRVCPAVALLDQRVASRIYQEIEVPDILDVLNTFLAPYEREVRIDLTGDFPPRDYCVQFRESDLRFHQRLMQEEGLSFYFDHSDDDAREVMVVVNDNRKFPKYSDEPIPYCDLTEGLAEEESIQSLHSRVSLRPTAFLRRDFDHRTPKDPIDHKSEFTDDPLSFREVYEHGARRFIHDDGDALAKRRLEQIRTDARVLVGRSNVTGLSAGHVFELEGHPRPELDGPYLVVEVRHFGDSGDVVMGASASGRESDYRNEFRCIPAEVPFRPAPTIPRPRIHGDLTGTVCGPSGFEIHTDDQGRVKVAMHWDIEGTRDENASCWIRVRQAWAGLGYGAFVLPRVGMEVLVSFLDGNPDRPLVTGCVYNGDNKPTLTLPDEQTKTTFRTNSSPGGEGFNELRIEDAAGCEEIYMHAQKDFNAEVLDKCSWSVGSSRSVSVGGCNAETITGNHTMHVDGQGGGKFSGAKVTVNGDYVLDTEKTIQLTAKTSITLTVDGGSKIHITKDDITLTAGKGAFLRLDELARLQSDQGSWVLLTENAGMKAEAGSFVALTDEAAMESNDKARVHLNANAAVKGKETLCVSTDGAAMQLTADALLQGKTTTCGAEGGGSATFEKAGATVAGKTTTIAGQSEVKITGALVNIG